MDGGFASHPAYALQRRISSRRAGFTSASHLGLTLYCGTGIFNPFTIGCPHQYGVYLRTRLTLIRLALIRKPWVFGAGVSHPGYRYSCLQFLSQSLHRSSPEQLLCNCDAPLPIPCSRRTGQSHSFGSRLNARKFSTPSRSISELLRTLSMNGCF